MKVEVNTKKMKESALCLLVIYWVSIVPLHITSYLFSINHYSVQGGQFGEVYGVLGMGWLGVNFVLVFLVAFLNFIFEDLIRITKSETPTIDRLGLNKQYKIAMDVRNKSEKDQ